MIPTIDLSLIGVLLIIWNVIKTIWSYFWSGFSWFKEKVAMIALGGRIWATAAFLAATLAVIALSSLVISELVTWLSGYLVSSIPNSQVLTDAVKFICTFFPLRPVVNVLSTLFSGFFYLFVLQNYAFWFLRTLGILRGIKSSWKT